MVRKMRTPRLENVCCCQAETLIQTVYYDITLLNTAASELWQTCADLPRESGGEYMRLLQVEI